MTDINEQNSEEFTLPIGGVYLDRHAQAFGIERDGMTDEQLREKIIQIMEKNIL